MRIAGDIGDIGLGQLRNISPGYKCLLHNGYNKRALTALCLKETADNMKIRYFSGENSDQSEQENRYCEPCASVERRYSHLNRATGC